MDRFRESVALSKRCSELWEQVLRTGAAQPAALTFFDGTIHMGPAVVLRGDERAVAEKLARGEEMRDLQKTEENERDDDT